MTIKYQLKNKIFRMESFKDDWCPPTEGAIIYYFSSERTRTHDAKDLFTGLVTHVINTSHFGEDDFDEKYTIVSPEISEQSITFKFSSGSMSIDKYSIECVSYPITSWILEATNNSRSRNWDCLDQRSKKLLADKRYTFKVNKSHQPYKFFRLKMLQPNSAGRWLMFLHYFNLHGDFSE